MRVPALDFTHRFAHSLGHGTDSAARPSTQDRVNQRVYHSAWVERYYRSTQLSRVETMVLLKYAHAFVGRDVLDVGIGLGRTTLYLAPLARRYEGIDYSPSLVQKARERLPGVSLRLADMRGMPMFGDGQFDFIFGSNNVIDAVSHEDRLKCLAELRRLLRPGGLAVLSSHNRDYHRAMGAPSLAFSRNPVAQARGVVDWVRQWANHARVGRARRIEPDYALLNDEGHHYACLHYYIDQAAQRRQMAERGFRMLDVLDHEGRSVSPADNTASSPTLMYVAAVDK
ncbi:MAG TPA: class I SAM-dependent methyltransferase [Burkholderiales bacterium]|nr:class I SAM-dependent methyltransferase [Burkholderiales bacterium]